MPDKNIGLTQSQAQRFLEQYGSNEIPVTGKKTFWTALVHIFREPMFLLLLIAGLVYLAIGSKEDAAVLMGFVVISIALTLFQPRFSISLQFLMEAISASD